LVSVRNYIEQGSRGHTSESKSGFSVSPKVSHLTKGNAVLANIHRIQRNRELNGERGFTLIELLIVIVVLGILAAIVVFALGGVTSSSAAAACSTDAQSVNVAIAAEQAQTPNVPPTAGASGNLVPSYLATWPTSSFYTIGVSGNNTTVALTANDPGTVVVAAPNGGPTTLAQTFNGTSAYKFPTTGWATNMSGNGICSGA
jgi:prepilin-type N-terminal cleavage/methylation domain-containing protein